MRTFTEERKVLLASVLLKMSLSIIGYRKNFRICYRKMIMQIVC